jgi:hypothetical protein
LLLPACLPACPPACLPRTPCLLLRCYPPPARRPPPAAPAPTTLPAEHPDTRRADSAAPSTPASRMPRHGRTQASHAPTLFTPTAAAAAAAGPVATCAGAADWPAGARTHASAAAAHEPTHLLGPTCSSTHSPPAACTTHVLSPAILAAGLPLPLASAVGGPSKRTAKQRGKQPGKQLCQVSCHETATTTWQSDFAT